VGSTCFRSRSRSDSQRCRAQDVERRRRRRAVKPEYFGVHTMRRPDTVQHEEEGTELKRKMPGLNAVKAFEAASTTSRK
jgi:hypothetical protein